MRKYLVVLDDTRECLNAMRYAAMRAAKTGGGVMVLAIVTDADIAEAGGADQARARALAHFDVFAKWMRDRQNVYPELEVRQGDASEEVSRFLSQDPEIVVIVLGAAPGEHPLSPLAETLTRHAGKLPVPLALVPGQLTKDQIEAIT